MKKQIFTIAAVCAAACSFCACRPAKNEYDTLNDMLHESYSQIELTVTMQFDEYDSLTSEYTFKYSGNRVTVNYAIERYNTFDLDGPMEELKTTMRGEAVIEDGVIVSINGDETDLSTLSTTPGLTFKEQYFANAELTGVYFLADVEKPIDFFGANVSCSNMKVKATFGEVFHDIRITYTSTSGNAVEYKYLFTK